MKPLLASLKRALGIRGSIDPDIQRAVEEEMHGFALEKYAERYVHLRLDKNLSHNETLEELASDVALLQLPQVRNATIQYLASAAKLRLYSSGGAADVGREDEFERCVKSWFRRERWLGLAMAEARDLLSRRSSDYAQGAVMAAREKVELLMYCWREPSPGQGVEQNIAQQLLEHLSRDYEIPVGVLEFRDQAGNSEEERTTYFIADALLRGISKDRLHDALIWHVETPSGPASYFLVTATRIAAEPGDGADG